jgi:hypothetical protein
MRGVKGTRRGYPIHSEVQRFVLYLFICRATGLCKGGAGKSDIRCRQRYSIHADFSSLRQDGPGHRRVFEFSGGATVGGEGSSLDAFVFGAAARYGGS